MSILDQHKGLQVAEIALRSFAIRWNRLLVEGGVAPSTNGHPLRAPSMSLG